MNRIMEEVYEDWYNRMSPGVKAGRIPYVQAQYDRLDSYQRGFFTPSDAMNGGALWWWIDAAPIYDTSPAKLDPSNDYDSFKLLVNDFIEAIRDNYSLVEADEDDEFTYGAFCTAVATAGQHEMDWVLEHVTGTLYSVKKLTTLDLEDGNGT